MNTFIEKNKKFLKFYHVVLRLSGWFFLTSGLSGYVVTFIIIHNLGSEYVGSKYDKVVASASLSFMLWGLLGLGIAQLIRYLFAPDCKP